MSRSNKVLDIHSRSSFGMWRLFVCEKMYVRTFLTNLLRPSWSTNKQTPAQSQHVTTRHYVQQDTNENLKHYVIIGTQIRELSTVNTNSRTGQKTVFINIYTHTQLTNSCLWVLIFIINNWFRWGHAVVQWLRHCDTNLKVAGLIPDSVIGIFH
jgi:hypothetical protein